MCFTITPPVGCVGTSMSTTLPRPGPGSSGIVVQTTINVALPTYDWNSADQLWEFQLFKH